MLDSPSLWDLSESMFWNFSLNFCPMFTKLFWDNLQKKRRLSIRPKSELRPSRAREIFTIYTDKSSFLFS